MNNQEAQLQLELQGFQGGILRYNNRLNDTAFSETKVGLGILGNALDKYTEALQESLIVSPKEKLSGPKGPKGIYRDLLGETLGIGIPLREVSYVVTKTLLDVCFKSLTKDRGEEPWGNYGKILKLVSTSLNDHHNFVLFRDSPEYESWERLIKTRSDSHVHRLRSLTLAMNRQSLPYRELSPEYSSFLGAHLVEIFVESTGLIYMTLLFHPKAKGRGPKHLKPTPEVVSYITSMNDKLKVLEPIYSPMIIPSIPWEDTTSGGYLSNTGDNPGIPTLRFIRSSKVHNTLNSPEFNPGIAPVFRVADILGKSAFRINKRILRTLDGALRCPPKALSKILAPEPDDLELPGKSWTPDETPDPEVLREWKRKASAEYDRVLGRPATSLRIKLNRQLMMAHTMEKYPAIYFPHNVDFRGRYYPIAPFVNPQSDDTGVSLLEFSRPSRITDENIHWYLIHGANLWGKDKDTYENREQFVSSREFIQEILKISEDPLGNANLWCNTDSPMMFLAWALEYAEMLKGNTDETHQIISVDGTCNGLQHYSAMLRDPVGALGTNLMNSQSGVPSDIYREVAEKAKEILRGRPEDPDAAYWLPLLSRKVVKRNVMTTPYGVTKFGMQDQLNKELKEIEGMPNDYRRHTVYLSRVIYEAMGSCIQSAQAGMDWLREAARLMLEDSLDVSWTTPLGLFVSQRYTNFRTQDFYTRIGKRRVHITSVEDSDVTNRRKNISAFPPNFVHSLDASHLGFTVLALHDQHQVVDFSMVHDSYGTTLDNIDVMSQVLREQFSRLYTEFSPLEALRGDYYRRTGRVLPACPRSGTFDLSNVLSSKYFFM